jgi:hypothetical protein
MGQANAKTKPREARRLNEVGKLLDRAAELVRGS